MLPLFTISSTFVVAAGEVSMSDYRFLMTGGTAMEDFVAMG